MGAVGIISRNYPSIECQVFHFPLFCGCCAIGNVLSCSASLWNPCSNSDQQPEDPAWCSNKLLKFIKMKRLRSTASAVRSPAGGHRVSISGGDRQRLQCESS